MIPALRAARGVSLIEVLVSLVILSMGVLAVVGLQLVSTRNNADAGQRTVAAQLAYSLLERMRSNSTPTSLANYLTGSTPLGRASLGSEPQPTCTSSGTACSESQLASHDLWLWETSLDGASTTIEGASAGGLTLPSACITGPAGGDDGLYTITIVWRGTVKLPDRSEIACGRDPQAAGVNLYSDTPGDNLFRRVLQMQVYITARRRPVGT